MLLGASYPDDDVGWHEATPSGAVPTEPGIWDSTLARHYEYLSEHREDPLRDSVAIFVAYFAVGMMVLALVAVGLAAVGFG